MGTHARLRRLLLGAIGAGAVFGLLGLTPRAPADQRVLALAYDPVLHGDPNVNHLRENLTIPGVALTFFRGPPVDLLAQLLGQNTYDQVWLWDLDIINGLTSAADRTALADWFSTHRNVVLDGRSLGVFYENDASESSLSRNIVANLASRGGGLWVGAKYAPQGARTANAFLGALGFNPFAGSFENVEPVTGELEHPLLSNPVAFNAALLQGLAWQGTLGDFTRCAAPTGPQPNGPTLGAVVRDQQGNPLITTNIPEGHGLLGAGLGAAYVLGRRRRG